MYYLVFKDLLRYFCKVLILTYFLKFSSPSSMLDMLETPVIRNSRKLSTRCKLIVVCLLFGFTNIVPDTVMILSEKSDFESIYGQPLTLSTIHHEKCLEYILEKPLVPIYKQIINFSLKIPWEVRKETLLMVPHVGLQISTIYRSGCVRTAYISCHSVKDVLINEAITGQKVLFYLALVIKQSDNIKEKLIPLFQNSMPRLNCLEKMYRGIHEVLSKR